MLHMPVQDVVDRNHMRAHDRPPPQPLLWMRGCDHHDGKDQRSHSAGRSEAKPHSLHRMLRRQYIAMVAVLVITAATATWASNRESDRTGESVRDVARDGRVAACLNPSGGPVSGGLPSVELPCMSADGPATVRLSDYAEAKPMLIALWASYCRYCRDELKAIDAFRQAQRDGIHVLTVLTADNEGSAELMLDVAPDLPVAFDREGQLFAELRVAKALPVVVVVRPGGTISKIHQGVPLLSAVEVSELVSEALRPTG